MNQRQFERTEGNSVKEVQAGNLPADGTFVQAQRAMAGAVMRSMTNQQRMQSTWIDGRCMYEIAEELIKPNDRLTSFERLEIYNRQYWFRLVDSLSDDFPGLCKVLGQKKFDRLVTEYLNRYPSSSFTLRNLGNRLAQFIEEEPQLVLPHVKLCRQMANFEWAKVLAFDGESNQPLKAGSLSGMNPGSLLLRLQPYISLLECDYAFDDFLCGQKRAERMHTEAGSIPARSSKKTRIKMPNAERIYVAVHRFDNSVYYKRLEEDSFVLLKAISAGVDLENALANTVATIYSAPDDCPDLISKLSSWFETWSELGWFY